MWLYVEFKIKLTSGSYSELHAKFIITLVTRSPSRFLWLIKKRKLETTKILHCTFSLWLLKVVATAVSKFVSLATCPWISELSRILKGQSKTCSVVTTGVH